MGRKYYRRLNDDTWFEYDMWESGIVNPGTYYPMPLWLKIFFLYLWVLAQRSSYGLS